jgi:hypothetical protein
MKVLLRTYALVMLMIASGCVMVPYTPEAQIEHLPAQTPSPEDVILTIGPRRFLEDMGAERTPTCSCQSGVVQSQRQDSGNSWRAGE